MGRAENRKEDRRHRAQMRLARIRLKQHANSAILRGQLLNEAPRMKMTPLDAVDNYIIAGLTAEQSIKRVVEIYKQQIGEDITDYLLTEIEARHLAKPKLKIVKKEAENE